MTKDLISHPLFRASVLEADDVAESVVKQVLSGQSGQIVLPKSSSLASSLRAFPIWLQEFIRSQQAAVLDRTKLESGSG